MKYQPHPLVDLTGKIFGRLTVLKRDFEKEQQRRLSGAKERVYWLCKCSCGSITSVRSEQLKTGGTKSCGCYNLTGECKASKTHGKSRTPEYRCWQKIKDRCFDSTNKFYSYYGGRGITMCDGYRNSFDNFYSDLGDRPTKNHSIDRVDNEGNYSCGKCDQCANNKWSMNLKWSTRQEQSRNTRAVKWFEFNGTKLRIFEWATLLNTTEKRFRSYVRIHGIENAIDFFNYKLRRKPQKFRKKYASK